jgi:hypothetical protein
MKLEFSRQIFEKYSDIKFYEIPSSGGRVPCGQTGRRTDMTKLIVYFRNFANSPKNAQSQYIDTLLAYTICVSFDSTRPEARLQAPTYRRNISSTAIVSSLNYYKSFHRMEEWHKAVGPFLHCFRLLCKCMICFFLQFYCEANTHVRRLTTAMREKCVVRRFPRCANVIECTYTNLDSTV